MPRESRNPFGTRAFQTGDWKPAVFGALLGVGTLVGLWYGGAHGLPIGFVPALLGCIAAFFVGLALLLLKKRRWPTRRRWWTELLGAALAGPVCVVLVLCLGYWPLPVSEVGSEDWSEGVAPS